MASGVISTGISAVIAAISYPVYLHFLGYEKYGVWLILSTIINFSQLSNLGIGTAVMKLVSEELGHYNKERIQKYVMTALMIWAVSGTVVLSSILLFRSEVIGIFKLSADNSRLALWLLPYIGLFSFYIFVVQIFSAALSGIGRMDIVNYLDTIGRVVILVISAILLNLNWGIESLLVSYVVSYLFVHLMTIHTLRRLNDLRFVSLANIDYSLIRKLLEFGIGMVGSSIIDILVVPFNRLVLSRYAGVSSIPVFDIAYTAATQFRNLLATAFRAISPEISRLSAKGTDLVKQEFAKINRDALRLNLLIGVPLYIALIIFAEPILRLWLGSRFVDTLPLTFQIILVGTFLSLLGVPSYFVIMGLGRTANIFVSHMLQSSVNAIIIFCMLASSLSLSTYLIALSVAAGMGISSVYLIWQRKNIEADLLAPGIY